MRWENHTPTKLTAFKFSPITFDRLEEICIDHGKRDSLYPVGVRINRTEVIRYLINKEFERIIEEREKSKAPEVEVKKQPKKRKAISKKKAVKK